jgi:hypothetical protein
MVAPVFVHLQANFLDGIHTSLAHFEHPKYGVQNISLSFP